MKLALVYSKKDKYEKEVFYITGEKPAEYKTLQGIMRYISSQTDTYNPVRISNFKDTDYIFASFKEKNTDFEFENGALYEVQFELGKTVWDDKTYFNLYIKRAKLLKKPKSKHEKDSYEKIHIIDILRGE